MTRVLDDSAEPGDLLELVLSSGATNVTTTPRSGNRCYAIKSGGAYWQVPAEDEHFFSAGISIGATDTAIKWLNGTTELGSVRFDNAGKWRAYVGTSTLVASGTMQLILATWLLAQVHVLIANSAGIIQLKIEGLPTLDINYSGDTQPGALTTIDRWAVTQGSSSGPSTYVDNVMINDVHDGIDDSWPPDVRFVMFTPNGNGDRSEQTGSDGNKTDNYLLEDEVPPDGDTTFVVSSTLGEGDLYAMSTAALPANSVVDRVFATARIREETAVGDSAQIGIKTEGVEYWDAGHAQTTTYRAYNGEKHRVNPQTGVAWTQAELDAIQAGTQIG
jgi:hypothetical protein